MRQKRKTPGHEKLLELLKNKRRANELTQVELAERLQVRQSYISNYETGERRLDVIEFILVCHAIGADPTDVIGEVAKAVEASPPRLVTRPKKT